MIRKGQDIFNFLEWLRVEKGYRLIYEGTVRNIEIFANFFEIGKSRFLLHCGKKCLKIRIEHYDEGLKNKGFNQVGMGWKKHTLVYVCSNCGEMHEVDDWDYGINRMSNTVYYFKKEILDFVKKIKRGVQLNKQGATQWE